MSNAHEQYHAQRELARLQRRKHGADTTRDEAEERHEAIWVWVHSMRIYGPLLVAVATGWISPYPVIAWCCAFFGVLASLMIGGLLGSAFDWVMGVFDRDIGRETQNFFMHVGGLGLVALGVAGESIGIVVSGLTLFGSPWIWKRWSCHVMSNTDFAIMEEEDPQPSLLVLRIIE